MTTEEIILHKASEIFYRKGKAGARMQDIADKSGINKAMLHYYFKNKEQLFERVFTNAFQMFVGGIVQVLNSSKTLEEKVTEYVAYTTDALSDNPGIPVFVLNELSNNPQLVIEVFTGTNKINLKSFKKQVEQQTHKKVDAETLFIDMVTLCVYPFIIAPVFKKLLVRTDKQYAALMQSRKTHITDEILRRLKG